MQGNVSDEFKIWSNIFGNNGYRNGSLPYLQNINVTKSKEIERRRHCIDNITRNTTRLSGRALNALPRSLEIVVKADVGGKEFTRPFSKFCSIKFDVDQFFSQGQNREQIILIDEENIPENCCTNNGQLSHMLTKSYLQNMFLGIRRITYAELIINFVIYNYK